jgi:hypothetical protein
MVYESGESMRFDEKAITIGMQGIQNVFTYLGMKAKGTNLKQGPSIHLKSTRWIRAPRAGMFIPQIENGQSVKKGEVLGLVTDTFARKNKKVKAPFDGHIICINHQAVINQGDALFHIGR